MGYLGLSGSVSFSEENTKKYNKLLSVLGSEEMLTQFERWMDENDLKDLIKFIEDNLNENQCSTY